MTDDVYRSLKNILVRREKVKMETIVDGYSRSILLDKNSKPKVALHILLHYLPENLCRLIKGK